jgi:hypothetical protein
VSVEGTSLVFVNRLSGLDRLERKGELNTLIIMGSAHILESNRWGSSRGTYVDK